MPKSLIVIDPAVRQAEIDCFNQIVSRSGLPARYHLPALAGTESLVSEDPEIASAVIVLGSENSANMAPGWQRVLERWLDRAFQLRTPVLGICFGHQMIQRMFGAEVGYVEETRAKRTGLREVTVAGSVFLPETRGRLVVSHNEYVRGVPSGMRAVGTSAEFPNDIVEHRELPILTLQPHPEATLSFLKDRGIQGIKAEDLEFGHALIREFLRRTGR